jgi:acyl carrier protein
MHEIERDVRAFIRENFIVDGGSGDLRGDASLTRHGVLDSMGVLELIMFLEQRYGVAVPDEDALPENLDSVDAIVRYVEARLAAGGAAARSLSPRAS